METLPLAPLPSENHEKKRSREYCGSECFIDEAVVLGVIARGTYDRVYVKSEDMVLASNEDDYAGWALPVASPFRNMLSEGKVSKERPTRLPAPPVRQYDPSTEAGLSEPYRGGHRWWMFGISGAMACGILSLTLLSLAQRSSFGNIAEGYMPAPRLTDRGVIVEETPVEAPTLTSILPNER
ncbi:MAG: hypothetical protein NWT08_04295 [Akkermansiaceae bacterium]|jgi:hypothetical protein|nr:hypothetical protein [Akkermansiaceae bacterium]MDP4646098.1 hypothetical protein [Akkermansiaceae bacterium]MDP4720897.1 hypothetical protein [Akkermansiaceae bacterium]MDP4780744.1 hypothetical protein [Akkermansiaceae bacterium]MDP4845690.1 hypothetical protein [Akkermansiaceae bacterium]